MTPISAIWLCVSALADPSPEDPVETAQPEPSSPSVLDGETASPDSEVSEEVTVWSEQVSKAKEAVVAEIRDLGYTRNVREREGKLVFVHEQGWKGKVVLYDDGRIATLRTGPSGRALDPLPGTAVRPYFLCLIQPTACLRAGSWGVSDRRWMQVEDQVARATSEELVTLGDRMADEAVARVLSELPDCLDALWCCGAPLEGDMPMSSYEERRRVVLTYWDTRTETVWGLRVREVIASFVRGEIETSEHPYTSAEKDLFETQRRSVHSFPW